jgi:hypothetical protein
MSQIIDLGQVSAIKVSAVPPTNIKLLWYDTNITTGVKLKYWDTELSLWVIFSVNDRTTTISGIRAITSSSPMDLLYTKDKGQEGYWRLDSTDTTSPDNTGTVLVTSSGKRFKRVFDGKANLRWFGAKGDDTTNDTVAIQTAWNTKIPIYAPAGNYRFTTLEIQDAIAFEGAGSGHTFLKPLPSAEPIALTIAEGPVTRVTMSDFYLLGLDNTGNLGQHGFEAKARVDERNFDGGLWWSTFERVFIGGFDGDAIRLIGVGAGFLPIQINYFESCEFYNGTNVNSRAMYQDGQVEQMQWTRCAWSGKGASVNHLAILFDSSTRDLGSGGGAQTFSQCYVGQANIGMECHFSINQKWYGTYFEALGQGVIDLYELTTGMLFDGSGFQASGTTDAHDGFLVRCDFSSNYTLINSHLYTQPDYIVKGLNQGYHKVDNLYGFNQLISKSEGDYSDIEITLADGETDPTNGRIKLSASRNGLNGIENTVLKWIDSPVSPGKEFVIQSNFGFDVKSGGNIFVLADLRVFINDSIVVKRIDDYYHVVAYIPYRQDGAITDVIKFGAKGGSTNNDTEAFQAAHDYVMLQGGGTVIIPFKAEGYYIEHINCSPFCLFIGHNNVQINPITSAFTEVFTLGSIPVIPHKGYFINSNVANVGQTPYNFTYTQATAETTVGSGIINLNYLTDFTLQASSISINSFQSLLTKHGTKIRFKIDGLGDFDDYIRFTTVGNISLPAAYGGELILRDGDVVEFTRRDKPDKLTFDYLVTSIVRKNIKLTTLPSQGQWIKGEVIEKLNPADGDNMGWICTTSGNYAATPPDWLAFGTFGTSGGGGSSNQIFNEIPTGLQNGVNTAYGLAHAPLVGKVQVFLNGALLSEGDDYTITGATLTMIITAPISTDKIKVTYLY